MKPKKCYNVQIINAIITGIIIIIIIIIINIINGTVKTFLVQLTSQIHIDELWDWPPS